MSTKNTCSVQAIIDPHPNYTKGTFDNGMGATTIPKSDLEYYVQAFNDFLGIVDIKLATS